MKINETKLNKDISSFMINKNKKNNQKCFFMDDSYLSIKEIIDAGGKLYTCYENDALSCVCMVDIIEDNNTIEVYGPFGNNFELRKKMLEYIKNLYKEYKLILYVSKENEFITKDNIVSSDCKMEINKKIKYRNVSITQMDKDDIEQVSALHDFLFPNTYYNGESLCNLEDEIILVYKDNNEVRGYIAFNKEELYIDFVGVKQEYRNKGIGYSLVMSVLASTSSKGIIHLSVKESNKSAVSLYKKCGFEITNNMISIKI